MARQIVTVTDLTLAELATLYNTLVEKQIKKFSSRAEAERRVSAEVGEHLIAVSPNGGHMLVSVEPKQTDEGPVSEPTIAEVAEAASDPAADLPLGDFSESVAEVVREEAVIRQQAAETLPTPEVTAAVARRQRGPAPAHADEDHLTVLVPNKKRVGSASHARFALYLDGMTVGDYLDACVALQGGKREKYRADIRWDHAHGFVGSYTPRQWANSEAGRDIEDDGNKGA